MIRSGKRLRLCIVLLTVNLIFIWGNSLLPGELSGALSQWLKELLHFGGDDPSAGHGLLRKLAHFAEFACLGACLSWLFGMLRKNPWLPLVFGFLAACLDETIQIFVPDRGPAIRDVLIDTAGVCLGLAALLLGHTIYKKHFGGNNQ